MAHDSQRQKHKVVITCGDVVQVNAFDDRYGFSQQDPVSLRLRRGELFRRDVIDADQLDTGVSHQLRGIRGDVGEVLVKGRIRHPMTAAIAGAEENSFRSLPVMLVQFGRVDGEGFRRTINDANRADEAFQRDLIQRNPIFDEMHGRVDVSSAMSPHVEGGEREVFAGAHRMKKGDLDAVIPWVGWSGLGVERCRDVDP